MSELILIGIDFSALPDAETFYCLWADEGATRGGRETGGARSAWQVSKLTAALGEREWCIRDSERERNIGCTTFPDHKSTDKKL